MKLTAQKKYKGIYYTVQLHSTKYNTAKNRVSILQGGKFRSLRAVLLRHDDNLRLRDWGSQLFYFFLVGLVAIMPLNMKLDICAEISLSVMVPLGEYHTRV